MSAGRRLADGDFDFLAAFAKRSAGITLSTSTRTTWAMRLDAAAREAGLRDAAELISRARAARGAWERYVLDAITIHETRFFRDERAFDALATHVVPALIESRKHQRTLSIWSSACSTGQEVYSVAILLRERFPQLSGWTVRLLASDVSPATVDKAREGRFTEFELSRGLAPARRQRWFERGTVSPELRAMVDFRTVNLVGIWPAIPRLDIVLMRNVLVYLEPATRRMVLDRARQAMHPDGYLLLGHGETLIGVDREGRWTCDEHNCYRQSDGIRSTRPVRTG